MSIIYGQICKCFKIPLWPCLHQQGYDFTGRKGGADGPLPTDSSTGLFLCISFEAKILLKLTLLFKLFYSKTERLVDLCNLENYAFCMEKAS